MRHHGVTVEVFSAMDLRAAGYSERALRRAVAAGDLLRIRRDRYCPVGSDPAAVEAIRIGGVLGCVSALRAFGVWVTETGTLHVHLSPNAARLRRGSAVRHWTPLNEPPSSSSVSIVDALITATRCQPLLDAVSSIDSALSLGLVRRSHLVPLLVDLRGSTILGLSDGRAQSGLETRVRVPLRRLGLRVQPQAPIPGGGFRDLLVQGCVAVETDGRAFHSGPRRHIDHTRDAAASAGGLTPLRFDSMQVLTDLETVIRSVVEAVGQHRLGGISGERMRSLRRRIGPELWT